MSQAREMSGNAKATLYSYMELAEDVAKEDIQKVINPLDEGKRKQRLTLKGIGIQDTFYANASRQEPK